MHVLNTQIYEGMLKSFQSKQKRDLKKYVGFSYMALFWKVSQAENFSVHYIKKKLNKNIDHIYI